MQPDPEHLDRYVCSWCGLPATDFKLVKESVTRKKDGVPKVIAAAEYAPSCAMHMQLLVVREDEATRRARRGGRAGAWKKRQERMF